MAAKAVKVEDKRTRQEKARDLRWKRGALESLGSAWLMSGLEEIEGACSDVKYYIDEDDETLINALDGDEEQALEFKMMFADLGADADRLRGAVEDWQFDSEDYDACTLELVGLSGDDYDDATVAMMGGEFDLYGYDTYERDYYRLTGCIEGKWAQSEAAKRLMRKTKQELLDCVRRSWCVFLEFFDLQQRYAHMRATMDIIRGDNTALLSAVKRVEERYQALAETWSEEYGYDREREYEFDRLLREMPDRAWVE